MPARWPQPLGPVNVDRWIREGFQARGARVLCDGVDITSRCRWFDTENGRAECFATDPPTLDWATEEPAIEILRGRIEVVA